MPYATQRFLLLTLLFTIIGCNSERTMREVDAVIVEAKQLFTPDRRTAVCDVQARIEGSTVTLIGEMQSQDLRDRFVHYVVEKTGLVVVDSLLVLPQASLKGNTYGVVSVSVASIRSKPGHAKELATQALLGTPLRVLKKEGGWYYVQTPDDYLGWMDDGFELMDQSASTGWAKREKVIITANYSTTYRLPKTNSDIIGDVVAGCILGFVKNEGAFYQVEYPDTRRAFLPKESAQPYRKWLARAQDTPTTILATAKRFFGVSYLWGGTSPKAMDCSGFTKTVYFLNGVLLPRDASQQVEVGKPVEVQRGFENLQAGDLLFFGSKATEEKKERVTHVGIYLGNMKFIHESEDVHINSLNRNDPDFSEFRFDMFLHARRIIGAGRESGVRRIAETPYYRGDEF